MSKLTDQDVDRIARAVVNRMWAEFALFVVLPWCGFALIAWLFA